MSQGKQGESLIWKRLDLLSKQVEILAGLLSVADVSEYVSRVRDYEREVEAEEKAETERLNEAFNPYWKRSR